REHGHERVAFIGGPPGLTSGTERLDGDCAAARELGLVDRDDYMQFGAKTWSAHSGAEAMDRLLALDGPPTAVVTAGESFALGALAACRRRGPHVPQDGALAACRA